jgi:predicted RNase H-like HicB family nuclease
MNDLRSSNQGVSNVKIKFTLTDRSMKLTVIVHEAIEGGYWAEVPAIPGCATEGDSWDELISNLHEAIEGCLSIDPSQIAVDDKSQVLELAI